MSKKNDFSHIVSALQLSVMSNGAVNDCLRGISCYKLQKLLENQKGINALCNLFTYLTSDDVVKNHKSLKRLSKKTGNRAVEKLCCCVKNAKSQEVLDENWDILFKAGLYKRFKKILWSNTGAVNFESKIEAKRKELASKVKNKCGQNRQRYRNCA